MVKIIIVKQLKLKSQLIYGLKKITIKYKIYNNLFGFKFLRYCLHSNQHIFCMKKLIISHQLDISKLMINYFINFVKVYDSFLSKHLD